MGDGSVVLEALGSGVVQSDLQVSEPKLIYSTDAEPATMAKDTIALYQALLEKARMQEFSPFTVGGLKVFLAEQKPGAAPAQIIFNLESRGVLVQVSGKKTSRSDPPLRAVIVRPVCDWVHPLDVFIPPECMTAPKVEEPVVVPPTATPTLGIKTKSELEQDLAAVEANYANLEDEWNQKREQFENDSIQKEQEIAQLRVRIEELEGARMECQSILDAHLVSKPEGLDELRHKRVSLQKAIDVYDEIAPLYRR